MSLRVTPEKKCQGASYMRSNITNVDYFFGLSILKGKKSRSQVYLSASNKMIPQKRNVMYRYRSSTGHEPIQHFLLLTLAFHLVIDYHAFPSCLKSALKTSGSKRYILTRHHSNRRLKSNWSKTMIMYRNPAIANSLWQQLVPFGIQLRPAHPSWLF
jgi:hypothetical protein